MKAILTFAALHSNDDVIILTVPLYKLSLDRLLDLGGRVCQSDNYIETKIFHLFLFPKERNIAITLVCYFTSLNSCSYDFFS